MVAANVSLEGMRVHLGGPVIAAILLLAAGSAQAGTLTVTNTADHPPDVCDAECTLRDAITAAQAGDVIQFAPGVTGTITLSGGQLVVNKNLTILGPGARLLAISGNNSNPSRIFSVTGGVVNISGFTLSNGFLDNPINKFGGAAIYNNASVTVTACAFYNNRVRDADTMVGNFISGGEALGGAVYNNDFATFVARDCTFNNNSVEASRAHGAGLWNLGTAVLINCTFSNNILRPAGAVKSAAGGGVFNKRGHSTFVNCTVLANYYAPIAGDTVNGGGVYAEQPVTIQKHDHW